MRKLITLCLIILGVVSLYAKGTSQFIVTTTPKMSCQNCVKKIEGNLRFEKGVKNVKALLDSQTVTVTYDPEKTDEQKLTKAFEKLKYTVTPVDAKVDCEKKVADKKCDGISCCDDKKTSCDGKKPCCSNN